MNEPLSIRFPRTEEHERSSEETASAARRQRLLEAFFRGRSGKPLSEEDKKRLEERLGMPLDEIERRDPKFFD